LQAVLPVQLSLLSVWFGRPPAAHHVSKPSVQNHLPNHVLILCPAAALLSVLSNTYRPVPLHFGAEDLKQNE